MAATICQYVFVLILFLVLIEACTGFPLTSYLLRKMAEKKGETEKPDPDEDSEV